MGLSEEFLQINYERFTSKLVQESNLTARQLRRAPHHVIQATTSKGLAQGPYVQARVGFEPATLQTQGTELTTEPPRSFGFKFINSVLSFNLHVHHRSHIFK